MFQLSDWVYLYDFPDLDDETILFLLRHLDNVRRREELSRKYHYYAMLFLLIISFVGDTLVRIRTFCLLALRAYQLHFAYSAFFFCKSIFFTQLQLCSSLIYLIMLESRNLYSHHTTLYNNYLKPQKRRGTARLATVGFSVKINISLKLLCIIGFQ